jgi:hypothetical protein
MTGTNEPTTGRRRRARHALAFAALCAALLGVIAVTSAGARDAKVLGKTKRTPNPACPNRQHPENCEVVGRATGFPLVANGEKRPFNVRENGKIVAWAVDLSRPTKDQRNGVGKLFKSDKFGKAPAARLAVIKHTNRRKKYRLLRQSPVVRLSGALGQKQLITLDKPLRVRKGQVVALTYPTWAPNFAHNGLGVKRNQWRASRSRRACAPKSGDQSDIRAFARKSKPQQKIGSERTYGCDYTGARLLYWAYYVRG